MHNNNNEYTTATVSFDDDTIEVPENPKALNIDVQELAKPDSDDTSFNVDQDFQQGHP